MSFREGLDDQGTYYQINKVEGTTPILFIHGVGLYHSIWEPQIKFFKDNFRVIAPALPGFGKSNAIDSCDSIKCMANVILNLLEKKEIKNFNLLGHSMG